MFIFVVRFNVPEYRKGDDGKSILRTVNRQMAFSSRCVDALAIFQITFEFKFSLPTEDL